MKTIGLAFRNLSRQKRRSFLLGGAVAFGFFIVTLVDALAGGALQNLGEQFSALFGGNVFIVAFQKEDDKLLQVTRDEAFIKRIIQESQIPYTSEGKVTMTGGTIIFEGQKAVSNIAGIDFDEKNLQETLVLSSGSWENMKQKDAILIGETMAENIGIEVGDTILIEMQTAKGYATVGEFTVGAINKDVSFLGSIMMYGNISYINELYELEDGEFFYYIIMAKDHTKQDEYANYIESIIEKEKPVTSRLQAVQTNPTNAMAGMNTQLKNQDWDGDMYSVFSFNDQVPTIKQILSIVQYVSLGVLVLLFLVIMIGISNTYKMVIFERIKEIGTMRAMGLKQKETKSIFMWEAVLLSFSGAIVGFVLAIISMNVLSLFSFTNQELSIFLRNGHWTYVLNAGGIVLKLFIVVLLTILAVRSSAKKASMLNPAEALRTVK